MKSFATRTRDSLTRTASIDKPCCAKAELYGFLYVSTSVSIVGRGKWRIAMRSEHPGTIRRMVLLLRSVAGITPGIRIIQANRLNGQTSFEIRIELEDIGRLTEATGFHPAKKELKAYVKNKCCQNALIRGMFLGCGTIIDPKHGYLMEWVMPGEETAQTVLQCIWSCFSLRLGITERKSHWVIYCKDSGGIMRILTEIGAHAAVLEIENMLILKNARNQANRAYNCDSGNIKKMVSTSERQADAIAYIQKTIGLGELSQPLREIAVARMENPGVSLLDLGKMLTPPIGKSGVSHRLHRIEKIAESISAQREEPL